MDRHTYPGIINLAGVLHLRLVPVGDGEGMRPDLLEKAAGRHRLKGVYLIPTLHNPTTLTMAVRRRELAEYPRRLDLFLVEDDVYGGMEGERRLRSPFWHRNAASMSPTFPRPWRLGCASVISGAGAR